MALPYKASAKWHNALSPVGSGRILLRPVSSMVERRFRNAVTGVRFSDGASRYLLVRGSGYEGQISGLPVGVISIIVADNHDHWKRHSWGIGHGDQVDSKPTGQGSIP